MGVVDWAIRTAGLANVGSWAWWLFQYFFPTAVGAIVLTAAIYTDWFWKSYGPLGVAIVGLLAAVIAALAFWVTGLGIRALREKRSGQTQGEAAPQSPTPARVKRHYSDFDRDRIAEATHKLMNLLNNEVVPIAHKITQLTSLWESECSNVPKMEYLAQELEKLGVQAQGVGKVIFREIYPDYQDYSQELRDITHTDRGAERELAQLNDNLFKMMKAVKTYIVAATTAPQLQAGVQSLVWHPNQNLRDSGHKLNGWADGCRARITQLRADLVR